jgi:hypothetical protein
MDSISGWIEQHWLLLALIAVIYWLSILRPSANQISNVGDLAELRSISMNLAYIADQMRKLEIQKQNQRQEREKRYIARRKARNRTDPKMLERLRQLTAIVERFGGTMDDTEDGNCVRFILPEKYALETEWGFVDGTDLPTFTGGERVVEGRNPVTGETIRVRVRTER